jgi:hypothetical protein
MKSTLRSRTVVHSCGRWFLRAGLACTLGLTRLSVAQSMLAPATEFNITPPAVQQYQQAQNEDVQVFENPSVVPRREDGPLATWGPVGIRPHAFYRLLYGDGIANADSNHVATAVQEVSPGILLSLGDHWTLDYTPTWRFYSSADFQDTLDHNVRLTGGAAYENWNFGLSQGYSLSSAPLVETGTQTETEDFSTGLNATYRFNSQMWMDLTLNQNIVSAQNFSTNAQNFNDYKEWSTVDWLNHQFWPGLNGGLGVSLGYVDGQSTNDMAYERLELRSQWRMTDKFSLHAEGGFEVRQFLQPGGDTIINPIAGAGIQYEPFEQTRISLTADRVVTTSYFEGQATETGNIRGNLNQRLLGFLFLDLGGGFSKVRYVSSSATANRTDDYVTFNARLSTDFLKRGHAAVFYQFADNSSSESRVSFSSNQVGLELGFHY